ncbi:MAG: GtrA family protein [Sphingobium sp.]
MVSSLKLRYGLGRTILLSTSSATDLLHNRRRLRYLAGAILCASVNNVVLIGVNTLRGPLIAGVLASWLLGGMTGFVWHSRLTYRSPLSLMAFLRFMAGALLGIPLAWTVLWTLTTALGLTMWLASPMATAILFCYHYFNAFLAIRLPKVLASFRTWLV